MITGEFVAFFIFALLAISGAVFMINFNKVVHMVIAAAVTFISIAGLYILLEAEFVAVVQILIYGGAITILMIFGIMLTRHYDQESIFDRRAHAVLSLISIIVLFGLLFYAIQNATFPEAEFSTGIDNTMEIGIRLFTGHVLSFELVSVLLTVAFIGAIVMAKREEE